MGEPATNICHRARGLRTEREDGARGVGQNTAALRSWPRVGMHCVQLEEGEFYVNNQPSNNSDFVPPPPTYKPICSGETGDSSSPKEDKLLKGQRTFSISPPLNTFHIPSTWRLVHLQSISFHLPLLSKNAYVYMLLLFFVCKTIYIWVTVYHLYNWPW